jgi:ADP-dependent phosphofructokinase/glucokinase
MQTVLPAEVIIQHILPLAPQLGTTCSEYRKHLPQIEKEQKANIKFPSVKNKNPVFIEQGNMMFEYEAKIDFKKLDEWIEHPNVQRLEISTHHPIFLEIKKVFEVILEMDRSVIDGWKYKNTFLSVENSHYDKYKNKKLQFVQMDWINSFVTSFIMYLYH